MSAPDAPAIVRATRAADSRIASGRMALSVRVSGSGGRAVGLPLQVEVSGPFESRGVRSLPEFDLAAGLAAAGQRFEAALILTGGGLYVGLGGRYYEAAREAFEGLRSSYEAAAREAGARGGGAVAGVLGVDPGEWLEDPVYAGEEELEGTAVRHVHARLDTARLLAAAGRLSGLTGLAGGAGRALPGASALASLISPAGRAALARSIERATADLYAGTSDHVLRALTAHVQIAADGASSAALGGLRSATIEVRIRIAALNRPQRIAAPSGARPLSDLAAELAQPGSGSAG